MHNGPTESSGPRPNSQSAAGLEHQPQARIDDQLDRAACSFEVFRDRRWPPSVGVAALQLLVDGDRPVGRDHSLSSVPVSLVDCGSSLAEVLLVERLQTTRRFSSSMTVCRCSREGGQFLFEFERRCICSDSAPAQPVSISARGCSKQTRNSGSSGKSPASGCTGQTHGRPPSIVMRRLVVSALLLRHFRIRPRRSTCSLRRISVIIDRVSFAFGKRQMYGDTSPKRVAHPPWPRRRRCRPARAAERDQPHALFERHAGASAGLSAWRSFSRTGTRGIWEATRAGDVATGTTDLPGRGREQIGGMWFSDLPSSSQPPGAARSGTCRARVPAAGFGDQQVAAADQAGTPGRAGPSEVVARAKITRSRGSLPT